MGANGEKWDEVDDLLPGPNKETIFNVVQINKIILETGLFFTTL